MRSAAIGLLTNQLSIMPGQTKPIGSRARTAHRVNRLTLRTAEIRVIGLPTRLQTRIGGHARTRFGIIHDTTIAVTTIADGRTSVCDRRSQRGEHLVERIMVRCLHLVHLSEQEITLLVRIRFEIIEFIALLRGQANQFIAVIANRIAVKPSHASRSGGVEDLGVGVMAFRCIRNVFEDGIETHRVVD